MSSATKNKIGQLADRLAIATEAKEDAEAAIQILRAEILEAMAPLHQGSNPIEGTSASWDVRLLQTSTVAWKKIAEQCNATNDLIAMHTATRSQVSFKRLPKRSS